VQRSDFHGDIDVDQSPDNRLLPRLTSGWLSVCKDVPTSYLVVSNDYLPAHTDRSGEIQPAVSANRNQARYFCSGHFFSSHKKFTLP
jgi:hypothetical protein